MLAADSFAEPALCTLFATGQPLVLALVVIAEVLDLPGVGSREGRMTYAVQPLRGSTPFPPLRQRPAAHPFWGVLTTPWTHWRRAWCSGVAAWRSFCSHHGARRWWRLWLPMQQLLRPVRALAFGADAAPLPVGTSVAFWAAPGAFPLDHCLAHPSVDPAGGPLVFGMVLQVVGHPEGLIHK
jgi:hypothetical protein